LGAAPGYLGIELKRPGSMMVRFRVAAALGAVTLLMAACSPGADYPAVLDRPETRASTPMTPDQVKAATDALILERDHLNPGGKSTSQASAPATTGSTQAAGAATKP
jgi:hypothetical protein